MKVLRACARAVKYFLREVIPPPPSLCPPGAICTGDGSNLTIGKNEYLAQELRRLLRIGEKYANMTVPWLEQIAINVVLGLLKRLSESDNGSEQLLAYGLHVMARKA